jgi:hypothetical protein
VTYVTRAAEGFCVNSVAVFGSKLKGHRLAGPKWFRDRATVGKLRRFRRGTLRWDTLVDLRQSHNQRRGLAKQTQIGRWPTGCLSR